jgi:peptidoglycan/xylan/chitin deacetylase (PgdA/CDA1 family)
MINPQLKKVIIVSALAGAMLCCVLIVIVLLIQIPKSSNNTEPQSLHKTPVSYPKLIVLTPTAPALIPTEIINPYPSTPQAPGTVRIPVLTYHHVGPIPSGKAPDYYVTPEVFEQQLAYLKAANYKSLTPDEFYAQLELGSNPTQKSVLITLDDGNKDNYTYAFPLLKKYGFTAVFAIITSKLDISPDQLREMLTEGMFIASHSQTHPNLAKLSDAEIKTELVNSRATLENITKVKTDILIYPGCSYNDAVIKIAREAGYKFAFTCGGKIDNAFNRRYALYRIHIYDKLDDFKARLVGINKYPY